MGSCQHASFGIPGGVGLFSTLQVTSKGTHYFINVTASLQQCFQDWGAIIKHMKTHLISVLKLVKQLSEYVGYSDSCRLGTGGVWTSGTHTIQPTLWQLERSGKVRNLFDSGVLSINNLELAGMVSEWLVLECLIDDLTFVHIAFFFNNTLATSWVYKLQISTFIVVGRLLYLLGLRIHVNKTLMLTPLWIPGENNLIADHISRAFKLSKFYSAKENLT